MKKRFWFVLVLLLGSFWTFNLKSNVHLLFAHKGDVYNTSENHFIPIAENGTYKLSELNLWRRDSGLVKRMINKIARPKMYLLQIKSLNGFEVVQEPSGLTSSELADTKNSFAINSSFYEPDFSVRGEVIVDGVRMGVASNSSGYFKVINGKAKAGPRSLFSNQRGKVEFSCQAHPSVMKDGVIWGYIMNESKNKKYWKQKTYRSLVGTNADGQMCFLISGNGGLVSIKEMCQIAKAQGIKTATMLDAGAALQYSIIIGGKNYQYSSWNNKINFGRFVDKVFKRIVGQRFYSSSPVFITHKE